MPPTDVHPQIAKVLEAMAQSFTPFETLDPAGARASMLAMVRARKVAPMAVKSTSDRTIPGPGGPLTVRVYEPIERKTDGAVVYFHGGGHVCGDLESHDGLVRGLCSRSGTVFVSVDYRLGPEHRFPAAVEDACAATAWVAAEAASLGVRADRIATAGDSAGANLAAVAALMARDAGAPPLRLQVLLYPIADYRLIDDSYRRYATGYGVLTARTMEWFRDHYLRSAADASDWRASPILAPSLAGVAPAIVITAECDVLHDEGVRYAEALRAADVPVEFRDFKGMIHGFMPMAPIVDGAVEAQEMAARAIVAALG